MFVVINTMFVVIKFFFFWKCFISSSYLWNSLGTQGRVKMRPIASPEVSFDKMCQPMEQSYGTQGHIKMRPAAWSWSPVR
jgi:hypothetical protein